MTNMLELREIEGNHLISLRSLVRSAVEDEFGEDHMGFILSRMGDFGSEEVTLIAQVWIDRNDFVVRRYTVSTNEWPFTEDVETDNDCDCK